MSHKNTHTKTLTKTQTGTRAHTLGCIGLRYPDGKENIVLLLIPSDVVIMRLMDQRDVL